MRRVKVDGRKKNLPPMLSASVSDVACAARESRGQFLRFSWGDKGIVEARLKRFKGHVQTMHRQSDRHSGVLRNIDDGAYSRPDHALD